MNSYLKKYGPFKNIWVQKPAAGGAGTALGAALLIDSNHRNRIRKHDALECFWTSPLDALVIGHYFVEK